MDSIILIGSVIFSFGVALIFVTTRWRPWGLFGQYYSINKPVSLIGLLVLMLGLFIVIYRSWLNGQLG